MIMSLPVERIQKFILDRLDENIEEAPRWQIILDKRLVKAHGDDGGECLQGCSSAHLPCNTLCFLALRWPEHADFNPDWNIL
jgi:hypothetical protein